MQIANDNNQSQAVSAVALTMAALLPLTYSHPVWLALVGAALIFSGLAAASWIAFRDRKLAIREDASMQIPAIVTFVGLVAATLCDIDALVEIASAQQ